MTKKDMDKVYYLPLHLGVGLFKVHGENGLTELALQSRWRLKDSHITSQQKNYYDLMYFIILIPLICAKQLNNMQVLVKFEKADISKYNRVSW